MCATESPESHMLMWPKISPIDKYYFFCIYDNHTCFILLLAFIFLIVPKDFVEKYRLSCHLR